MTLKEIHTWYCGHANEKADFVLLKAMADNGIVKSLNGEYSIDDFNKYVLANSNDSFLRNKDGKFVIREKYAERKAETTSIAPKRHKFKLKSIGGNKLKLIKVN